VVNSLRLRQKQRALIQSSKMISLSNKENFNGLYVRTYLKVFRYIFSLLGGPLQEVEDLTAKTYLRAWKSRKSFHGNENAALGWLLKIARNLIIDDHRRNEIRDASNHFESPVMLSTERPLEDEVINNEKKAILWNLLQELSHEQREIITLRYLLDFRVNQIATFLDIPENTVSVKLRRILEHLNTKWQNSKSHERNEV
jgi:RNA polymerase sigma-70 factor (ECF subfamily)